MRDEPIPYFAMLPCDDGQKVRESSTSQRDFSNKNEKENDKRQVKSKIIQLSVRKLVRKY